MHLISPRPVSRPSVRQARRILLTIALAVAAIAVVAPSVVSPVAATEAPAATEAAEPRKGGWLALLRSLAPPRLDPCDPPAGTPVPKMVAEIFRCRLAEHLSPEQAAHAAAEAVVVAECESLFDPDVVVFDGQYVDQPHPRTGMRYSAAGVFQFIRRSADHYVEGGYAAVTDPVANINGAVKLYLENRTNGGRGWESWECSAVNGAFKANSVLPGWPGGPAQLPDWAWTY